MKTRSDIKHSAQQSQTEQVVVQTVQKPSRLPRKFYNYNFIRDISGFPTTWTLERAIRLMQRSSSQIEHLPGTDYIWVDDLKDQHQGVLPGNAPREIERTSNSFLQYRILVQRAFKGKQTDISKEIEFLWRAESKEMQFHCYRNAEIETCIPAKDDN